MGKYSFYGFIGLALISFIFISSCENPNNSLEESVAPYLELQAVEGASNVNMTVNRGSALGLDSYFAVNFSNLATTGIVTEGLSEAWCLDYQRPINQNNDVHAGVKMFNTFGSDNWKSANYLMNIKDELKQNDPSLTYKEIQVALWSLIEVPAFNIDKALNEGSMPSRMLTNGSPNFDVDKTKGIVNKVRKEVDSFVYKPGTPAIVYSKTSDEQQPIGGVYGETAWAYAPNPDGTVNTNISTKFCDDSRFSGNNWGWTNGKFANGTSGTFDVVAGAGQCDILKGKIVGTFSFTYNNGVLDYTLELTVDNDFSEIQIYAGNDLLPKKNNGNYDTAPGKLGYNESLTSGIGTKTDQITGLSGSIYVAVHLGR